MTAELIAKRELTHGDFADSARCAQRLKAVLADELARRITRGQPGLVETQREAIDQMLSKIGRIVAGDPNHPDHWEDIGGYADRGRPLAASTEAELPQSWRPGPNCRDHPGSTYTGTAGTRFCKVCRWYALEATI